MPLALPTDAADVTPALITQLLHTGGALPGAKVIHLRTENVTGEVSFNAQIVRLWLTYEQPTDAAPRSLILKLPTRDVGLQANAAVFRPGAKEHWFYRRIAPLNPLAVPRCYYSWADPTSGESALLLEDLAAARRINQVTGVSAAEARVALRALAQFHAQWWGQPAAPEIAELGKIAGSGEAGANLVETLYAEGWPQFVAQGPVPLSPEVRHFGERLVGQLAQAEAPLDSAAHTLIHGDFRLDNLLFAQPPAQPGCWLLDWEDVSWSSPGIDLSWFLGGCLQPDAWAEEEALLRFYHACLVAGGVTDYIWTHCWHDYRCAMISSFVQGVLSARIADSTTPYKRQFAQVMSSRFTAACERLQLDQLLEQLLAESRSW